MKRIQWKAVCLTALLCGSAAGMMPRISAASATILVTDTASLRAALASASAGDEIVLREGVYQGESSGWRPFSAQADGTAENPIILRSEDPAHPATIRADSYSSQCVLTVTGSYWQIRDLIISDGAKGIFLQKSEHSVISGCEVCRIGDEAIHVIDNSSYNLVENCKIHDTGLRNPKYGEGVYIGSAKNATDYGFECHYNTVRGCQFGPNIAADHVDIKEYTIGTLVENCVFDGTGMQGENGGDSFVEIKGNHAVVRGNTGYRNGCEKQLYGFDLSMQLDGWGQENRIYDNHLYLDTADCYVVKGWNCAAEVFRNTVEPAECTCYGNKIRQVGEIRLAGDVTEDGTVDAEDAACLRDFLLCLPVRHLSAANSDLDANGTLDARDLALLKRAMLSGNPAPQAEKTVHFVQEDAGKWRVSDGLGGCDVRFLTEAKPGSQIVFAWGYWDPNTVNPDTGNKGKWTQFALDKMTAGDSGILEIPVHLPEDTTRLALEVWNYADETGKLDVAGVRLHQVVTP